MEVLINSIPKKSCINVREAKQRIIYNGKFYCYHPSQAYKRMILKHSKRQALIPIVNEM